MTVFDALKSLNAYPISDEVINVICQVRGVTATDTITPELSDTKEYNLAVADLKMWLSSAPNLSQGGVSWQLSGTMMDKLKQEAQALYSRYDSSNDETITYGYKGTKL